LVVFERTPWSSRRFASPRLYSGAPRRASLVNEIDGSPRSFIPGLIPAPFGTEKLYRGRPVSAGGATELKPGVSAANSGIGGQLKIETPERGDGFRIVGTSAAWTIPGVFQTRIGFVAPL